ncbi:MAG: response regulator transcription factor [Actinomycetota bacterium]|nr:response regulator transcription factor [Actinomycetota bacterium]MDK1104173.1 response regulator transcription factor [Actinomycetota bacterium]
MIKIVITDDHRIIREGLDLLLAESDRIEIVAHASDGPELIDILKTTEVDVVLLDVRMPTMTGLDVLERIGQLGIEVAVVMLSMYGDPVYVSRAIELGASGYLLKSVGQDDLLLAIETVAAGKSYFQPEVSGPLVARMVGSDAAGPVGRMTVEQLEILQLLADGADNSTIAESLSVSNATAKAKLRAIYGALGVQRRSEAVAVAMRLGLIT